LLCPAEKLHLLEKAKNKKAAVDSKQKKSENTPLIFDLDESFNYFPETCSYTAFEAAQKVQFNNYFEKNCFGNSTCEFKFNKSWLP